MSNIDDNITFAEMVLLQPMENNRSVRLMDKSTPSSTGTKENPY